MKFEELKGTQCYKCDSKDQNWCGGTKEELDEHKDDIDTLHYNSKPFWCTTDATCMMVKEGMGPLESRYKQNFITILCPFVVCI